MAAIAPTLRKVKADPTAICYPYDAGGSGSVGDAVYVAADGDVEQADADAVGTAAVRGVVVAAGTLGATTFVAGDRLSVCVHGVVELAPTANLTPGALVYNSPTAGAMDQTASATSGDFPAIVGWAHSLTAIFVNPQITIPVVVS